MRRAEYSGRRLPALRRLQSSDGFGVHSVMRWGSKPSRHSDEESSPSFRRKSESSPSFRRRSESSPSFRRKPESSPSFRRKPESLCEIPACAGMTELRSGLRRDDGVEIPACAGMRLCGRRSPPQSLASPAAQQPSSPAAQQPAAQQPAARQDCWQDCIQTAYLCGTRTRPLRAHFCRVGKCLYRS
jgi:hypothetical protein